jgi:hypothetical protein
MRSKPRLPKTTPRPGVVNESVPPELYDLTVDIRDMTEQVGKLANIIKKAPKGK